MPRIFLAALPLCLIPLMAHAEFDRHSVNGQYAESASPTHEFHVRGKRKPYRYDRVQAHSAFAGIPSRSPTAAAVVAHPAGCPSRAFCGCGASVEVFGRSIRELWLARAWFKFPRTQPAPGMVAVRSHHVFVLKEHVGGSEWLVFDANSGGHQTLVHVRSVSGYAIVNPRAG